MKFKKLLIIIYKFKFFLIFIDIQSTAALKNFVEFIDKLISCSEDIQKNVVCSEFIKIITWLLIKMKKLTRYWVAKELIMNARK